VQQLATTRSAIGVRAVALAAVSLLSPVVALAAPANCSVSDTSFECRLTGLLHWLEAAAFLLAFVLAVVVAVAIHLIRKNRLNRENTRPRQAGASAQGR